MNEPLSPEVRILNAALELSAAERPAYLDKVCAGEPALRQQINALLEAHEQAEGFLDAPPSALRFNQASAGSLNLPLTEKPGDHIGRYKLLEQIGEGGCGVVYMAEQSEPIQRRVALKVIKLGMDTREVVARFEAERQALAMMEHPNIAKVLDAGATDTGRPYFVMELVSGIKITEFCEKRLHSTDERLRLFVQVCHAIQHAHQKGVIHRDIKPSNVLVTVNDAGAGVPKVIDFGIAKATQGRLDERTVFTAFDQFIGTPAYMSPEQASRTSLDVDTRSDIYSLGVLLYELLTGKTPFEQRELLAAGLDEMRRTIREKEPVKPSTRLAQELATSIQPPGATAEAAYSTSSGQAPDATAERRSRSVVKTQELIHLLRGDLDWIVMKCLEKDRTRRYETANGLAADVQRHLNHELVTARPPTAVYRFKKLVQRNRLLIGALAIFGIALVLVTVGSSVAAWRVAGARRAEQGERQKAEAANRQLRETIQLLELERAEDLFRGNDRAMGTAHLAAMLRQDPSNALAATRLVSALIHRNWAVPRIGPMSHTTRVVDASFSPDGRRVLSASGDKTARIWDAATGDLLLTLPHSSPLTSAQYSPDGRRILTTSRGNAAHVWDAVTGKLCLPDLQHEGRVYCAEFSADGRWIVTGSADKTARLWDAFTGKQKQIFEGHSSHPVMVRLSPDGERVATGGNMGSIRLWSVKTGETLSRVEDRKKPLTALVFSPDGRWLLSACDDGIARLWNVATGESSGEPVVHSRVIWHAAFSPDSKLFVTACEDGAARLWNVETLRVVGEPLRHESGVIFSEFSRDGRWLVTSSSDNTARVWDVRTGIPLFQPLRHLERVLHAEFRADGQRLVTASFDGAVQVWDLHEPFELGMLIQNDRNILPFAFSPDGSALLTAARNGSASVWDTRTGQPLTQPMRCDEAATSGDLAPGNRRAVLGYFDGSIRVWDYGAPGADEAKRSPLDGAQGGPRTSGTNAHSTGSGQAPPRMIAGPMHHRKLVRSVTFNSDGSRFASASSDGTARVWDTATSQPITAPLVHEAEIQGVQFSRDDRWVVTASIDHTARVWDAQTGKAVTPPLMHLDHVKSAEFSPDGRRVLTASTDNSACIWSVPEGKRIVPPLQHSRIVEQAIFSPDGRRVATASLDRTARIWEAATGQSLTPPLLHNASVTRLFFTADGARLITVCNTGVRVWDATTGRPLTEWLETAGYFDSCFDPNSGRIAVGSKTGPIRIWETAPAPTPVPEWFPVFAEAMAGIRLGPRGHAEFVPRSELSSILQSRAGGSNDFYTRLARWFQAEQ